MEGTENTGGNKALLIASTAWMRIPGYGQRRRRIDLRDAYLGNSSRNPKILALLQIWDFDKRIPGFSGLEYAVRIVCSPRPPFNGIASAVIFFYFEMISVFLANAICYRPSVCLSVVCL